MLGAKELNDRDRKFRQACNSMPGGRKFNESDLKVFVKFIAQDNWWINLCHKNGIKSVEVLFGGDTASVLLARGKALMRLPRHRWYETIILHELAHLATPPSYEIHSQEFIKTWAQMMCKYTDYGEEACLVLEEHGFFTL